MKRNKLYTVNKWNQPAFMGGRNLFDGGGNLAAWDSLAQADKAANPWNYADDVDATQQYMNSTNFLGLAKKDNPFSKGNIAGGLGSMAKTSIGSAVLGAAGSMVGGAAYKGLSGGLNSGAGSAINSIGSTVGGVVSTFNPLLGAGLSAASGFIGGGINAVVGTAVDQEKLNRANEGTAAYNNFTSNADSFDAVQGPVAQANVQNAYSGGAFKKGWARKRNAALRQDRADARQSAFNSVDNNVSNIADDQMNDALANYAAFGGPIDTTFGGALGVMQQDKYIDAINNRSMAIGSKTQPMQNVFDFGGFVDNFKKDPVTAAMQYMQQRDTEEEQAQAALEAQAQQQAFVDMQNRLLKAETQNQGLQALIDSQARDIKGLQDIYANSQNNEEPSYDNTNTSSGSSGATEKYKGNNRTWKYVENQLRKSGKFNDVQIEGIKYNLQRESALNPDAIGDNGSAFGLGQWRGDRKPKDMSLEGQVKHLIETLSNYDGKSHWIGKGNYIGFQNARTPEEAHYYIAKGYERPNQKILEKVKRDSDMSIKKIHASGGKLGGGSFKGSGAGGSWNTEEQDTYNVENFNQAFDKAVKDGLKEFVFQGRRYNTKRENNPIREFNNRWVGEERLSNVKHPSKAYDHEAGPLGGPLSDIPMVTDTYVGSPERPPQLEYNPFAMERGKALPYSWAQTVDRPKTINIKRAFGGELGTNGTDWTNGLLEVNTGGSHESNPLEGVPMGMDEQGIPNLVEEGETVWNDYVFSRRLKVPKGLQKDLGLSVSKGGISFADASKKIAKESEQRPNDPISKAGLEAGLEKLAAIQEAERMKQQMQEDAGLEGYACGGKLGRKFVNGGHKFRSSNNRYGKDVDEEKPFDKNSLGFTLFPGVMGREDVVVPETPEIKDNTLENQKVNKNTNEQFKPYDTRLRYAPAVGPGLMTLTDLFGLTNKSDYTMADKLEAVANQAGFTPNVQYDLIGNYLRYNPMDIWNEQNALNAQSRATDRALANASGANRGAAMAGLIANGYNSQLASGDLYRKALEYNDAQGQRVADYNRKTDMFNSQAGLEASEANARYTQMAKQYQLSGLAQAAALREKIDARNGAARAANLTNFINSLGDIGRENMAFNMLNASSVARNGYWIDDKGVVHHTSNSGKYGGKIKRRK